MHRNGWCHMDIKPENVLIGCDAQELLSAPRTTSEAEVAAASKIHIRLCDFGVAALLPRAHDDEPLSKFCGSPGFFAPELLAFRSRSSDTSPGSVVTKAANIGQDDDPSQMPLLGYDGTLADIFSVGATLLEMLVGSNQFTSLWLPMYAEDHLHTMGSSEFCSTVRRVKSNLATVLEVDLSEMSGAIQLRKLHEVTLSCIDSEPNQRPISLSMGLASAASLTKAPPTVPRPPTSPRLATARRPQLPPAAAQPAAANPVVQKDGNSHASDTARQCETVCDSDSSKGLPHVVGQPPRLEKTRPMFNVIEQPAHKPVSLVG